MSRLFDSMNPHAGLFCKKISPLCPKVAHPGRSRYNTHRARLTTPVRAAYKGVVSKIDAGYNSTALSTLASGAAPCYWTYNYGTAPTGLPDGIHFVPMVFGHYNFKDDGDLTASTYDDLKKYGKGNHIIGFNEPDGNARDQSHIDVGTAVQYWYKVHYTARLDEVKAFLGSPAMGGVPGRTSSGGLLDASTPGCWLDQFLEQTNANLNGDSVDFICVHWYPENGKIPSTDQEVDDTVGTLTDFLDRVHSKYQKPVWLTEFSLVTYDDHGEPNGYPLQNIQGEFLKKAAEKMNGKDYMHRYSWFTLPPWKNTTVNLFNGDRNPSINDVGRAFLAA